MEQVSVDNQAATQAPKIPLAEMRPQQDSLNPGGPGSRTLTLNYLEAKSGRTYERSSNGELKANFFNVNKLVDAEGRMDVTARERKFNRHVENLERESAAFLATGNHAFAERVARQASVERIEYGQVTSSARHEQSGEAESMESYSARKELVTLQRDQNRQDIELKTRHAASAKVREMNAADAATKAATVAVTAAPDAPEEEAEEVQETLVPYRSTLSRLERIGYNADLAATGNKWGRDLNEREQSLFDERHQKRLASGRESEVSRNAVAAAEKKTRAIRAPSISGLDDLQSVGTQAKKRAQVAKQDLAGHRAERHANGKSVTYVRESDGAKVLTDHGKRISIARKDPEAIRAGILLASQRYKGFRLNGSLESQKAMALAAIKLGVSNKIANKDPELLAFIKQEQKRHAAELGSKVSMEQKAPQVTQVAKATQEAKASQGREIPPPMEYGTKAARAAQATPASQGDIPAPLEYRNQGAAQSEGLSHQMR